MIIVTGHLTVAADQREDYLASCEDVVRQARRAPGCRGFAISADLVELDRVNVVELWEDRASLEDFRADGPTTAQLEMIQDADVGEYTARALGQV